MAKKKTALGSAMAVANTGKAGLRMLSGKKKSRSSRTCST